MKAIICIALFSFSLFCNSQTWAPVGAKWYYNMVDGTGQELTVVESTGDTLINGNLCHILNSYMIYKVMLPNGTYRYDTMHCPMQFSYYDSGKIYLYDSTITDFRVLYNFTATVGSIQTVIDTPFEGFCPDAFGIHELFQYKVDSINDTVINGLNLLRFHTSATTNADWAFSKQNSLIGQFPILERIGSLKYIFGASIWQSLEGVIWCLRCYQDSTFLYRAPFWPSYRPCDYLSPIYTTIDENADFSNNIKIFPNPFQDYISIDYKTKSKYQCYEIYNVTGLLMCSGIVNENPVFINTSYLPKGLYFLKIKTNHKDLFYKVTKVN